MKKELLKKILPHLYAVLLFLATSMAFCKPALEGNVISQDDIIKWKGVAQNAFEYKEQHGHFPLWNSNLFSGMPNYQIAVQGKSVIPDLVKIVTLGMPKPINFFFLACICFYILALALGVKSIVGRFGAIAYAFSTYNAVLINAGHETQVLATAFMPLVLAGMIFTFNKKYWLGLAITTIGAYEEIGSGHLQITYYFLLIAAAITIAYLVKWIKEKEWKHIAMSGAITLVGAVAGLAGSALVLMTTSEYTKYTMRGGKDVSIKGDSVTAARTSGLDTAYAFEYSLGKAETSTLIMPNAFGGDSRKLLSSNSHVVAKLIANNINDQNAEQIATSLPKYWGALPYTAGPAYLGVLICILGIIGFVLTKSQVRWGALAVTILGVMMTWGKNLPGFNAFLFQHLPLYNKFRAPSSAQVIPQLTIGILAILGLHHVLYGQNKDKLKADFKKILYATGGLIALLALMYLAMDYRAPYDSELANNILQQSKSQQISRAVMSGMKADRMAMFGGQLLRTIAFALILIGLIYIYIRDIIKKPLLIASLILVIGSLELIVISKSYLKDENYISKDEMTTTNFLPTQAEQQILQDKDPDFRVLNMTVNPLTDSRTPYFFKSLTGYHPARLRIYQDIIDRYFLDSLNQGVVNMLNTKYKMAQDEKGQPLVMPNPDANGPCWLVKQVDIASGRVQALQLLGRTNLKETAIVDSSMVNQVVKPKWDSTSTITLTKFDNDQMEYKAVCNGPQFAVFSEIYYPAGWNAYVDGKKTPYCNADYILRGLSLTAGTHEIKFVFEPASFTKGKTIMYIASYLILILFLGGLFMAWRESKESKQSAVGIRQSPA